MNKLKWTGYLIDDEKVKKFKGKFKTLTEYGS